jgi:hypothetical protein
MVERLELTKMTLFEEGDDSVEVQATKRVIEGIVVGMTMLCEYYDNGGEGDQKSHSLAEMFINLVSSSFVSAMIQLDEEQMISLALAHTVSEAILRGAYYAEEKVREQRAEQEANKTNGTDVKTHRQ